MKIELSEHTLEGLQGAGVNTLDVVAGFKMLLTAKSLKDEADGLYKEGQEIMRITCTVSGITTLESNVGKVTLGKGRVTKTLDQDGMAKYLVGKGVSASLVAKAIEQSTTVKEGDPVLSFRAK